MNNHPHCDRRQSAFAEVSGAAACTLVLLVGLAGSDTQQQMVASQEDSLAAAGFIVRPANTPQRVAMLSRLPADRFVQRVRGNTVTYVYGDPLLCDCLYVGSQQAYAQYRAVKQQQQIANEQALAAQSYSDAEWDWGGWGYGEFGPGFGYGPGF